MQPTLLLVIWGSVAFVIFKVVSRIIAGRRHAGMWLCVRNILLTYIVLSQLQLERKR